MMKDMKERIEALEKIWQDTKTISGDALNVVRHIKGKFFQM